MYIEIILYSLLIFNSLNFGMGLHQFIQEEEKRKERLKIDKKLTYYRR